MQGLRTSLAWLVLGIWFTQEIVRADLIYFRPDDPVQVGLSTWDLDINDDAIVDLVFSGSPSEFECFTEGSNLLLGIPPPPPNDGHYLYPLELGYEIDASPDSPLEWGSVSPYGCLFASYQWSAGGWTGIGYWREENADGYLGVQFDIGGNTHYGWVHVINTYGITGEIVEWAYESNPNTGLEAGVIPEPTTLLLFLAGTGLLALRKKQIR